MAFPHLGKCALQTFLFGFLAMLDGKPGLWGTRWRGQGGTCTHPGLCLLFSFLPLPAKGGHMPGSPSGCQQLSSNRENPEPGLGLDSRLREETSGTKQCNVGFIARLHSIALEMLEVKAGAFAATKEVHRCLWALLVKVPWAKSQEFSPPTPLVCVCKVCLSRTTQRHSDSALAGGYVRACSLLPPTPAQAWPGYQDPAAKSCL